MIAMKNLLELYFVFLKIGSVAFGGGYAMLPILEKELVTRRNWITLEELTDYFAVGQCTPGIIAMNVSTFIGNKKNGVAGAVATMLGFVTVPFVLILIIAAFLTNFADNPYVQHAFAGIRVCVCVLILQAVLRLWKKSVVDRRTLILYTVILLLQVFSSFLPLSVPAAMLVIASGIFGLFLCPGKEEAE